MLDKYNRCLDLHETYQGANSTISTSLANVDPNSEYMTFIELNKTLVSV